MHMHTQGSLSRPQTQTMLTATEIYDQSDFKNTNASVENNVIQADANMQNEIVTRGEGSHTNLPSKYLSFGKVKSPLCFPCKLENAS